MPQCANCGRDVTWDELGSWCDECINDALEKDNLVSREINSCPYVDLCDVFDGLLENEEEID